MPISFYVRDLPVSEHVLTPFTTDTNRVSTPVENWPKTEPFKSHHEILKGSPVYKLSEGGYFVTTDESCPVRKIAWLRMVLNGPKNADFVLSKGIECATKNGWQSIELPLVNCSTNDDPLERENENAKLMVEALDTIWEKMQDIRLELIIRLTKAQELAYNIFLNSQYQCLTWDGTGFVPLVIQR